MPEYIDIEAIFNILLEENPFGWTNDDLADAIRCATIADVAPVVHGKRIKTKKHNWKKDIDGEIDLSAWDEGYCNGPFCLECGASFCIHCEEKFRGEDAIEARLNEETCHERTICSVCGRLIPEDAPYCNCGAKLDLE